ncbi:hypothetical protein [Luteitalea sp.]|uniref:hypothetical protein n=1 Tax=Luteitalea sp. TaxID=2004800 RepID=UPI0025C6F581|nr:hypothetical protein [Luteitalea sp.]
MPFVRLDDEIADNVKILRAGPAAAWMWAMAVCYSNRKLTDGFVPAEQIDRLTSLRGRKARELADKCVTAGLFDETEGGYQVHDYHDWNPTREKVEADKLAAAQRKADQRAREDAARAARDAANLGKLVTQLSQRDTGVTPPLSPRDLAGAGATPTPTPTETPTETPTPTETLTDETTPVGGGRRPVPVARLVSSSATAGGMGSTHLAGQELVEVWNRIRRASVVFHELQPESKRLLRVALEAKGLDSWEAIFRRIEGSDYLAGRLQHPAIGLFRAIELADRIAEGQYDNREAAPAAITPKKPGRWAIDIDAEVARQREAAAARGRVS